jgi:hypothetical protein
VRYVIVADFWPEDFRGGGGNHSGGAELSDEILFSIFKQKNQDVLKCRSTDLTTDLLDSEKDSTFILSNFFNIHPFILEKIKDNCRYILYCHDYKFVGHMQPQKYENFIVPKEELIFVDLFQNAKAVICQSALQEKIHKDNLGLNNLINFSGNLWSSDTLDLIESLSENTSNRNNRCSIVKSPYPEKGVAEAVLFCQQKGFDYDLIGNKDYNTFLHQIASNEGLVFWAKLPETCGRITVEAKMMNVLVHTTELLGASHEPWFNLAGKELIDVMRNKRENVYEILTNV